MIIKNDTIKIIIETTTPKSRDPSPYCFGNCIDDIVSS